MGVHLVDGEFQSDKYPTCPRGKVPMSTKDPAAQDLIWAYAQRRRAGSHGSRDVDAEFADDVEAALRLKGYDGPKADAIVDEMLEEAVWAEAAGYLNLAGLLRRAAGRIQLRG